MSGSRVDKKYKSNRTREGTISVEIVGCACLVAEGPFFNDIFTTNISVYFI